MVQVKKRAVLCMALSLIVIASLARGQSQVAFTGKVVDGLGGAIGEAKVSLYEMKTGEYVRTNDVKLLEEAITKADGAFSFEADASEGYREGVAVAHKDSFALGWASWRMRENAEREIVLTKPNELGGVVVDQDDKPVAGATVFVAGGAYNAKDGERQSLVGPFSRKLITTTTDESGQFTIDALSVGATFEIGAEKEGYATVTSFNPQMRSETLHYSGGDKDIKLVMPIGAKVSGKVVEEGSDKPVAGLPVMIRGTRTAPYFQAAPSISKEDGAFAVDSLIPDSYTVGLAMHRSKVADWVANPVKLTLGAGHVKDDVKVEVSKGVLLEFKVTEEKTGKPVEKASVSARDERSKEWASGITNAEGIALIRVMPGQHTIGGPYKQGYSSKSSQETITVAGGATRRIELTLDEARKVTGVVRDPDGEPVDGAKVSVLPGGIRDISCDSEGKFEIIWDRSFWDERETVFCFVARDEEHNLALAMEIGDGTKTLDVKLEPGVVLAGKVVDPDSEGIGDAQLRLMLHVSNWGTSLGRGEVKTNDDGTFEIKAIPSKHRYNINVNAKGYGSNQSDINTDEAVDNRLDVGAISLAVANLSLTGQIVDAEGNPVANADVRSGGYGDNQPEQISTQSDQQGNFILDGVCEGKINLRVSANRDGKRLSARVLTHGGASDIKIIVREGNPVVQYISSKTYEQKLATAEKLVAGIAVDEDGTPVAGVPVGVCCIKKEREDGKFSWTFSSYNELRDTTDEQGRFVIELEEGVQYSLRFSPDNHAAVIEYDIPYDTKDLKVTLPEGGTVNGRLVRMEKGQEIPIADVEVKLEQTDRASYTHLGFDRDRTTVTDSEGRFQFKHIRRKIRPHNTMRHEKWEYAPRVWQISYGGTSKNIVFYENTVIDDFELVLEPDPSQVGLSVGNPLPGLDGIKVDLPEEQTKDKAVLVCFFDMQQRPSRNCVMQLCKRVEELKEKGVVVAAVQASKVEQNVLDDWVKQQGISFSVGTIQEDEKKVRFNWGVKSLPWMILADKRRVVVAEGFGLSELDERIEAVGKSE